MLVVKFISSIKLNFVVKISLGDIMEENINNYDCIIIMRKSSLGKEYLELKEELFNLLLIFRHIDYLIYSCV